MITENVLKEWYSENASRRFPLATPVPVSGTRPSGLDDNGKALPNALLVGMQLTVPRTMLATRDLGSGLPYDSLANTYCIYLSRVVISLTRVELLFTTVSGEDIATAVWTPETEIAGLPVHGVPITPLRTDDPNIGINNVFGYVFLGPDSMWSAHTGIYTYSDANIYNSMVSESVIAVDDANRVTGLIVNGEKMIGDITFVAGENVKFSVDTNNNEFKVDFAGDLDDTGIQNREELIEAIKETYGDPVMSIDGVFADGDGEYTIEPADECIHISAVQHGITITAGCGDSCCDRSVISGLSGNVQELNVKVARIGSFQRSVAAAVNALQNELAYLKMVANQ